MLPTARAAHAARLPPQTPSPCQWFVQVCSTKYMPAYTASVKHVLQASDLVDQGTREMFAKAADGYDRVHKALTDAVGVADAFSALVRGKMRLDRLGQEPFVHCELPDEAAWAFPGKLAAHTIQSPPSGTCHPAATPPPLVVTTFPGGGRAVAVARSSPWSCRWRTRGPPTCPPCRASASSATRPWQGLSGRMLPTSASRVPRPCARAALPPPGS